MTRRTERHNSPQKRPAGRLQKTGRVRGWWAWLVCSLCCAACSDDEYVYVYPSLLTEFVELYSDESGNGTHFTTDNGNTYAINTPLQGLQAHAVYRLVCGYELTEEYQEDYPVAKLYTLESVVVLQEEDTVADADAGDPTGLTAIWRGGDYLNLQLAPKTQGGEQEWNYRTDSITTSASGCRTFHLSLCHRQLDDPYSYSTTVYASLPLYNVGTLQKGDSLTFAIQTFDSRRVWHFVY